MAIAIEAERLGKRYLLGKDGAREGIARLFTSKKGAEEFWALRDVSFKVEQGESVGIIGRNGAGKSTLLKLLARITAPTEGRAQVNGRVGTLLEVGTGFHQDLSGRENVFMSGTVLGQSYSEVKSKFDEIVHFSGVEKFIDTPVKRYSSGMQVRLAFAVALHLNADILIVDEVLAVGDMEFQRKSLAKLRQAASEQGRTVLFVSHSLGAVTNFCKRVMVMEGGRLEYDGATEDGVKFYRNTLPLKQESLRDNNLRDRLRRSSGALRTTMVHALDRFGNPAWTFREGDTVVMRVEYEAMEDVDNLAIGLRLTTPTETAVQGNDLIIVNMYEVISNEPVARGYRGAVEFVLPNVCFRFVNATPYIWFGNIKDDISYDIVDANVDLPTIFFRPTTRDQYDNHGLVRLDHQIRFVRVDESLTSHPA